MFTLKMNLNSLQSCHQSFVVDTQYSSGQYRRFMLISRLCVPSRCSAIEIINLFFTETASSSVLNLLWYQQLSFVSPLPYIVIHATEV